MKAYLFYINPSDERPGTERAVSKGLYAITNSKKLYKSFKSTRNMNIFELRVVHMESDTYVSLANENRESVLEWCKFRSKKDDPYPKTMNESFGNCVEDYKFAVTFLESQGIQEAKNTFFEHIEMDLPNPYLFSKPLKRIFKRFGLDYMYKISRFPYMGDDIMYCTDEEIAKRSNNYKMTYADSAFLREEMDYSTPDIWIDDIEVFLEIYGHLMNI